MSFLRKRPPIQSNRQQQQRALAASHASSSAPAIKKKIPVNITPQPVPGTYTDYKLVSTSRDVLHHVLRFQGQKIVTPRSFTPPVKLHRKKNENPHRGYYGKYSQYNQQQQQNAGKDAKDADKKDGAAGTAGAGTAPGATPATTGANTALIAPYGGGVRNKQMLFKKRTRQIYIANEDERKKKEIEAAPWVLDDYDGQNNWTGQLEGGQGANYVLFVFAEDGFKVVPADKWYKFSPKLQYATLTAEEAEEQYQKSQKQNNSSIRWLMRSKNKKAEDGEEGVEEDIETEQLLAVDHDDDAGYDEDEAKDRKRKRGKHGDADEMDFDEVWQDDEEMPVDMPGFDEDAKDDPRNKQGPQMDSDEDEDDEDDRARLNETGKAVKKALRKLEKNRAYASDDDKDPYASDKDSSDSDLDEIDKEKDQKKEEETSTAAVSTPDLSKNKVKPKANAKTSLIPKKASAVKPVVTKPVSAKVMKNKPPVPAPRSASTGTPSAGKVAPPSASSSSAPRGSSPSDIAHGRAGSPGVLEKKRKKIEGSQEQADDLPRKVPRASESSTSGLSASHPEAHDDANLITESEVITLLKSRPRVTTRDLINELKKKLKKDERNKNILATVVKKVAIPQDGILLLKDGF
ncbi:hypothetical protein FBU30_002473 [Linnemannia zychae]|nr:hypothetical protein FBU30_002473 [Linnemannia zychae]